MRLTNLLGKTLREPPSDAQLASHQLLVRAACLRAVEPGLFAYLPLGQCVLRRLYALLDDAFAPLGMQHLRLPAADQPDQTTLLRLVAREVDSYRQLPLLLLHHTAVHEPEPRVRTGLLGAAIRPAATVYVLGGGEASAAPLSEATFLVEEALCRAFDACGLAPFWAGAGDAGRKGSRYAYLPHDAGDEDLVRCPACAYAAPRPWATTRWPEPPGDPELPTQEIETPGCNTIVALAAFLDIPASKTLKMVFYSVEGAVTCLVIRGDRQIDEGKLARLLGTTWYYPSMEHELAAVGAVGGYASPIGLDQARVRVVADPSIRSGKNFVSGANRPDYHIRNVNVPRDFRPGEWTDLALVESGDPCPHCGAALVVERAFVLALSTAPALAAPPAEYLDAQGRAAPLWTATWHLDLARFMAAVVEAHHDDHGILWPAACAPFDIHLVALDLNRPEVAERAEALYAHLQARGLAVLFDDRDASAGVKFNDADLIGVPLRLTISKRAVAEGVVEAKRRSSSERLKLDDPALEAELARLLVRS
ncbi:MAG: hypothetical protein JXA93_25485 [Anaerolineae bacterium]|nr:hypothetical protein [Anaerolineae bacterium]